jgi:hypothetical protein
MRKGLKTILGISALCLGVATLPAKASENRASDFAIPCDGQTHTVSFFVSGLGTASSRFIQGAEISVFANANQLQFLILSVNPSSTALNLLTLGVGNSHAARDFTGFFSVPNNFFGTIGNIGFELDGSCTSGSGANVTGRVVIGFFS